MSIWKVIKAGGFLRREKGWNSKARIKLLSSDHRPVAIVKASCFSRLYNLDRLVHCDGKYVKNPKWHGNCKKTEQ